MKFMIGVDLEGVACVVGVPDKALGDSPNLEFARRQATKEANATAKALFDVGAEQVVIWDNHASSLNLLYDELDERCDIVLGVGADHRWPGLDSTFSGVLMIGYHPMDNTPYGVLAHTFSSKTYQWVKINDVEVGEIEIDAAIAGETGVPLIFVSSDDKGTSEVKRFMPWVETVTTKMGLGWNLAYSKHPARAAKEIYEGVRQAVGRIKDMKPFTFGTPISIELRFKRLEHAQGIARSKNGWTVVDPYTVKRHFNKLSDYF